MLYKPKSLLLVAMDEGVRVRSTNLRWTGWGTAKAVARGSARLGDEDNGYYTAKVTVRLTKIVKAGCSDNAGKYRAYSQGTLVEGTGGPTGDSIRFQTLGC
ncbi:MAG: hypothetical protein Q7T55_24495 [Solirubrobacteraceae bacterium]|nr:hypothetical protein [Solirubrobacteraceae bacterium]